jgi:hypothetical protein
MVCHNLPLQLRYHIKNVFLAGIIPGPHEPSHHHLNHLLHPLVDDLLNLWSPGVQLMCAATNTLGSLVCCTVAPLVCDLPVIRKTAGFAGYGAHAGGLCSFCLQDASDISNTNIKS